MRDRIACFLPWGIAEADDWGHCGRILAAVAKLRRRGGLAVLETVSAKMRIIPRARIRRHAFMLAMWDAPAPRVEV